MKQAIFLDRDGVINRERKDYVKNIREFEIFNGVGEAIKLLKDSDYLILVITNQSAINRKLLSVDTLNQIHDYFQDYLKKYDTSVDGFYFCPHIPEDNCSCRKPKPGLLLSAMKDWDLDIKKCHMFGDSMKDVLAAKEIGCKSTIIDQGQSLLDVVKKFLKTR